MLKCTEILRCLNRGVLLVYLFGFSSVAVAQDSLQEASTLNEQVAKLYQQGQYREAIPLAQRVLEIYEKVLGPEHPDTAAALNNLALFYDTTNDAYTKAKPLYERALSIREKVLGPEHPDTVKSISNLAGYYWNTGNFAKAESFFQRALAVREKVLGPEHPDTATSLNALGEVYRETAAYAKAEPLYQRALAIREKVLGLEHPDTATPLNNLAEVYRRTAVYAKAEPLYKRALGIVEKVLGPEHPDTVTSLNNLAVFYDDIGAYSKAEPLYQRALAIREKTLGPQHALTALSLNNLAGLYKSAGAYAKAEPLYQRALTITEKELGSNSSDTATLLKNLASLYRETGAYAKAESLYQRALAIHEKTLGPEHPLTASSLNSLAVNYIDTSDYVKAEPLYQRALMIREKVLGVEHPDTAVSLSNLAGLYRHTGAYAQAELYYQRALAIREKVLDSEHPDIAASLNNLAVLYDDNGAYAKAKPLYQRALAIREKVLNPDHPDIAASLNNLGSLAWQAENSVSALPFFERAQAIDRKNIEAFLPVSSEVRRHLYVQQFFKRSYATISWSLAVSNPQGTLLGLASVFDIKGRVLDTFSDSVARLRQSVNQEDHALFDQLTAITRQLSTLTYQGLGRLSADAYRTRLADLTAQQEQLEGELSKRSAAFRQQASPITPEAVRSVLPPRTALIEWFRYRPFNPRGKDEKTKWNQPHYVAYVLRKNVEPAVADIGEAEVIDQLTQDFRKALSDPQSMYTKEVAAELYVRLMKPLLPHLSNLGRLLISPDGALNLVPFGALIDDEGRYLAAQTEVAYLTSGRDLISSERESHARAASVVVANPDFGPAAPFIMPDEQALRPSRSFEIDHNGVTFNALPGTAEEAKTLKELLKVSEDHVLTQAKATEERFKQIHRPRILHVATHGFFLKDNELPGVALKQVGFSQDRTPVPLGENPLLRSGLALAGANVRRSGENDDGILTAAEVAQIDLHGTQLVVLSACETGIGDVQNGEGVYGLRRALVLAGAETQVTSLWKVADEATKDLMVDYYQRLLNGEGRSEALRNAQLSMMKSKDRSHPYYWAAFVPIGDWRPLGVTK